MSELIVDETGELRGEHEGVLLDRQVGVLLVASDVVVGELDDAGQGQRIEPDESSCDADVQGQRGVVEAAQQLVSGLVLGLEVAWELRGWALDDQTRRAEASRRAPAEERDRTGAQGWPVDRPDVQMSLLKPAEAHVLGVEPVQEVDCGEYVAAVTFVRGVGVTAAG
ncbi:hypothetical protein ACWEWI_31430 [Streptomyces sp. NPDC003753]